MIVSCPGEGPEVEPPCTGLFDCLRSQNSWSMTMNGLPVSVPVLGGTLAQACMDWADCQGIRVESPINSLEVSFDGGAFQPVFFDFSDGVSNCYTLTFPCRANDYDAVFRWGKGADPSDQCTETIRVLACEEHVFPDSLSAGTFPDIDGPSLPGVGQTLTLANGIEITCFADRHSYSTRLAVNLSSTKYLSSTGNISDMNGNVIGNTGLNSESVWSMSNPNIIYGFNSGTGTLWRYDCSIMSGVDLGIPGQSIGPSEGNVSTNNLIVIQNGSNSCLYNLSNSSLISCIPTPNNLDSMTVSINGKYVVADISGGNPLYWDVNNFTSAGTMSLNNGASYGHSTTAIDCNGQEVAVYVGGNRIRVIVLATNQEYVLPYTLVSGATHLSGNACDRQGWLYGSFVHLAGGNEEGFVGALELCPGSSTLEPWGSFYATDPSNIQQQPRGSVSKDGLCINFASAAADGVNTRGYKMRCPQGI